MTTRLRRTRIDSALILAAALASCAAAPIRAPQTVQGERTEVPPLAWRIRGRVVDPSGAGVAGVPIVERTGRAKLDAVSRADGSFVLEIPYDDVATLRARHYPPELELGVSEQPELVTAIASDAHPDAPDLEHVIVVAPRVRLSGVVEGAAGAPLERAAVGLAVRPDDLAGFPLPLDAAGYAGTRVFTDASGQFSIDAAWVEDAELEVSALGFVERWLRVGDLGQEPLLVRLERWPAPLVLQGRVQTSSGAPAIGATVQFDTNTATAQAPDGTFRLSISHFSAGLPAPLGAALVGHQPWLAADASQILSAARASDYHFDVALGPPALAIEGRLVDSAGRPLADWWVELHNGGQVSWRTYALEFAEHISGGRVRTWRPVVTNGDGRFRIDGLRDREYVLDAWDPEDEPALIRSAPIRAGTRDVELVLPNGARIHELRGRLVDLRGAPLANVHVGVALDTPLIVQGLSNSVFGPSTITGGDGCFELAGIDRYHGLLSVTGPHIVPRSIRVDSTWGDGLVDIATARRAHFRVDASAADPQPDRIRVVGATDEPLTILGTRKDHPGGHDFVALLRGQTHVLAVPEDAREVVLLLLDRELARVPLALEPGSVAVVRWPSEAR